MSFMNFLVNVLNESAGKEGKQFSVGGDWHGKMKPTDKGKSITITVTNNPKAQSGKKPTAT